ncbi:MAG: glycosyltransferase family 39 protein, partial [Candidatus Omnitrophota bacterium]
MTNSLKAILGVFLIVLSAYAFLAGGHYGGDAFNNYLTTQSLVLDRDIAIYDRPFEIKEVQTDASQGVPGKDGKRYSAYGMGMPLLQVPFFLVGMAISFFMKDLPANYVTFFCVSFTNVFLSAVNVVLLLVLLQKLGVKLKEAITLSLVYAFSTMALVYSKSGFPEPALVTFMLIAMVSLFSYVKEKKGMGYLVISGAALGFMAMIKVYTVILAPAFLVYFLSASGARRRYAWVPMIAFLAVLSVDLWANFIRSGNILVTGYGHVITQAKYGNRFLKALYYYWFSIGKGFFFYNLPLILG